MQLNQETLGNRVFTVFATLCVLLAFVFVNPCCAQFHESFDSEIPTWKRHESDCPIVEREWAQRRGPELSSDQAGNYAEQIKYHCGPGTKLLLAHKVTPSFVIPELKPSVRIRSSRRGLQLGVRVVLPHTQAPGGDGPMTTLIMGPVSKQTAQWETLEFGRNEDIDAKLKTELWMLRGKFGSHVNIRDAYVDRIVLNLYTGQGQHSVEIDDLKLNGIVEATRVSDQIERFGQAVGNSDSNIRTASANQTIQAGGRQIAGKQPSHIVRDGTVLLVRKRPYFPRIVEHNGENFDFLKAIGFNTVELKTAATDDQLKQANDLDLWLIAPPPTSVGLSPIGFDHDRILAWSLGQNLTSRDLPTIQQRIREIRESDQRENRPLVANAKSHWSSIAAQCDILSLGLEPLGTSFIASVYGDWIKRRSQTISSAKPIWVDVQTELSAAIENQAQAIFGSMPPAPIELQQVRFLTAEAISAGARGLRFKSRSRLDQSDPVTRLRALTCQYNNRWLQQIEPWLAGGALMRALPTQEDGVKVTAINTNRARLLLIQRPTHHEQYWAGDCPLKTISIRDPDSAFTSRVYQLTDVDIKPLSSGRSPGGTEVIIEDCPYLATVVMTEDPMVINGMKQNVEQIGQQSMFQMHTEITRQWMAIMQLVDRQMARVGHRTPAISGSLNDAINAFQTVNQMIGRNSPTTALPYLDRTDERLAFSRREIQGEALGLFQSKSSTPLLAHCSLVPLHWNLASQLQNSASAINSLAGGDFENLELMKRSGWENHRNATPKLRTNVELSQDAATDGRFGLKMSVVGQSNPYGTGTQPLVETVPVWVKSPRIRVRSNQLVRIHGWVNVPKVVGEDGLMIVDTLGTKDLAERIAVTQGWQEFTLYRMADQESDFRVQFELNGIGTAMIDEVTVRVIDLPGLRRQADSSGSGIK